MTNVAIREVAIDTLFIPSWRETAKVILLFETDDPL
jgi:hypothetical protein